MIPFHKNSVKQIVYDIQLFSIKNEIKNSGREQVSVVKRYVPRHRALLAATFHGQSSIPEKKYLRKLRMCFMKGPKQAGVVSRCAK